MGLIVAVAAAAADKKSGAPRVLFETSMGDIVIELDPEKAPKSVENFLTYAQSGFYDGTIFHRVIDGFMIQGGGFNEDMTQKPTGGTIENEADNGLKNKRGTIAMARRPDPHSASSQFFINTVDNRPLDHTGKNPQGWGYAVFGEVVEGMDVVDAIEKVKTGTKEMFQDVPIEPVVILKTTVETGGGE
ncbi:MAG: peptidyl-prolyl cis-trans isomerase [Acidobacteria bacterium]|nr:MAG: peptidyl-prolyl cis-trans isomerase [Acidobacteriota bacterium]